MTPPNQELSIVISRCGSVEVDLDIFFIDESTMRDLEMNCEGKPHLFFLTLDGRMTAETAKILFEDTDINVHLNSNYAGVRGGEVCRLTVGFVGSDWAPALHFIEACFKNGFERPDYPITRYKIRKLARLLHQTDPTISESLRYL